MTGRGKDGTERGRREAPPLVPQAVKQRRRPSRVLSAIDRLRRGAGRQER